MSGPASAPDLDAWRAEAGEAARLDAHASPAWEMGRIGAGDGREVISGGPVPIGHICVSCVTVGGRDGSRRITPEQRDNDALFAVAARTGWPRDAARVGVLCAEVERLAAEAQRERERADEVLRDDTDLANTASRLHAEVATLRAALSEALDLAAEATDTIEGGVSECKAARADIARLRALAAGEEPTK